MRCAAADANVRDPGVDRSLRAAGAAVAGPASDPAAAPAPEPSPGYGVPDTMRALVLSGRGMEHLAVVTVPTPEPGPGQLLARVDAAGICTSLVKLIAQGSDHAYLYGWDPSAHPLILGDEGSVTIVGVGASLRGRYAVGERYVVQPAVDHEPIRHRSRYRNVEAVHKLGVGYTLPGHLAEYVPIPEEVLEAECLLPLPDADIAYAHAAIGEPISCVVSAHEHHLHLTQASPGGERRAHKGLLPRGVTVVVGAGSMGRMHVDVALGRPLRAIVVVDLLQERLQRTLELFADRAERAGVRLHAATSVEQAQGIVGGLTGHRGADDVIVAAGSARAVEGAQALCGRGAVLHLFGGFSHESRMLDLDGNRIHYRETVVTGSSGGSPWDLARTLELLGGRRIDAGAHITRVADLSHAPELIASIARRELDGKAVVYPHRRTDTVRSVDRWTAADEAEYLEEP